MLNDLRSGDGIAGRDNRGHIQAPGDLSNKRGAQLSRPAYLRVRPFAALGNVFGATEKKFERHRHCSGA